MLNQMFDVAQILSKTINGKTGHQTIIDRGLIAKGKGFTEMQKQ